MEHLIRDKYTAETLKPIKEAIAERRTHEVLPVALGFTAAVQEAGHELVARAAVSVLLPTDEEIGGVGAGDG